MKKKPMKKARWGPRAEPSRRPAPPRPKAPKSRQPERPTYRDAERGMRLQKAMAEFGVASRRDCEAMIEQGRVRVNGDVVNTLPAWVDPTRDEIEVDGHRLNPIKKARRAAADTEAPAGPKPTHVEKRHTYIMVHKPRNTISTNEDPEGRRRVIDLVEGADLPPGTRLYPVGRLDADSTGLILLTDDGELANRLTHPRYEITKDYEVAVKGKVSQEDLAHLKKGVYLADRRGARVYGNKRASVEEARIIGSQTDRERGDRTALHITLREGQNREIRRVLARLGFNVRRLKRVGIGPLKLRGVAVGGWRRLTGPELSQLRKAAGLD